MAVRLHALVIVLLGLCATGAKPMDRWERAVEVLAALREPALQSSPVKVEEFALPGPSPVRAKLYVGPQHRGRALVLLHGVHHQGVDEQRIVRFAHALARVGVVVLTPELEDLASYRITSRGVEVASRAVEYLSHRRDLVPDGKVGLVGFSFAGGLGLVAASQPEVARHLSHAVSVGGHHDLSRILRFYLSDELVTPSGTKELEAHEYGIVVLLHAGLDRIAPARDRERLRVAIQKWLHEDRAAARAEAKELATERGRRIFSLVEAGRLEELRPALRAWLRRHEDELSQVSPRGKLGRVPVPVYLLHGSGDRVIPPSELLFAAQELQGRPHRAFVSSIIEHVSPNATESFFEMLELIDFLSELI